MDALAWGASIFFNGYWTASALAVYFFWMFCIGLSIGSAFMDNRI